MAQVKPRIRFIATTKDKINKIKIVAGQMIFVADDRTIYLDIDNENRTVYQSIISLADEKARETLESPIKGFYYVEEDNSLWNYVDSRWELVTGENPNLIFPDNGLPKKGASKTVYVDNSTLYIWDEENHNYEILKARIDWEEEE